MPLWWRCGLAQWFSHRIDARWNNYDRSEGRGADKRQVKRWEQRVRAFAKRGSFAKAEALIDLSSLSELTFDHFAQAWSRVDFLLQTAPEHAREYMDIMKDPTWRSAPGEQPRSREQAAIHAAFELELDEFDARWRAGCSGAIADSQPRRGTRRSAGRTPGGKPTSAR